MGIQYKRPRTASPLYIITRSRGPNPVVLNLDRPSHCHEKKAALEHGPTRVASEFREAGCWNY
jgi:hypothetical protein